MSTSNTSNNTIRKGVFKLFFEITIVIIGITIAFSLDRWNQRKTNKDKFKTYVGLLISDLEGQKSELEGSLGINKAVLEAYNKMLTGLQGSTPLDELFEDNFSLMQSFSTFVRTGANTYSIMQQSGDVGLIEDIKLKSRLLAIETDYERILSFEASYLEKRDRLLDPYILKFFNTKTGTFNQLNKLNRNEFANTIYLVSDLLDALIFGYENAIKDIELALPDLQETLK